MKWILFLDDLRFPVDAGLAFDKDRIFELGPEVKVELTVKVTPVNPVTRSANIPKQTPLTRY
jgi:hypothetical protein